MFVVNTANKDTKCKLTEGHGEFAGKPRGLQVHRCIHFTKMETKILMRITAVWILF